MRPPSGGALLRVAVAAGLTAFVLWQSNPAEATRALAGADWRLVAATVALVFADRALNAWRWFLLLRPLSPAARPPLGAILHVFFVSTFVGTFLPTGVGGDAVRAYALSRLGVRLADSVASVFLDRAFGSLSILVVAAVAAAYAPPGVPGWLPIAAWAATVAGAAALGLAIFSARAADGIGRLLHWLPGDRIRKGVDGLSAAIRRHQDAGGALLAVLGSSIVVQVLRICQAWLLGLSLGIDAGPGAYFIYVPVILFVMLLPVTVFGLGTSQWAFVALFGYSGVAPADAFALSVLFVALGVVGNLPGGILYATGGLHHRSAQAGER